MHTGEVTWEVCIGVYKINFSDLTQISFPKSDSQWKSINEIKDSIEKEGLLHPFDVEWVINSELIDKLRILRGNQRIEALRKLGWTEAPCSITVRGFKETEDIGRMLKRIFTK